MDFLERFNSKFGSWYEGLFGGEESELRPKDILRKLTTAMEDHRKEGFDSKVYVPNKYVLELSVSDPEERDYLLSFLDEEELVSVLQRFMAQNHYHTRGPLDFTISETDGDRQDGKREKLRVKVRFEKADAVSPAQTHHPLTAERAEDLPTVSYLDYADDDEPGTVAAVAWAALAVTSPDGRKSHFSITRPQITIGRSRNAGNDLVLDNDGMASKIHARLEREPDGRFALFDTGSTNGIKVNGVRIEGNRLLKDGDEILIGATKAVFQQAGEEGRPIDAPPMRNRPPRVRRGPMLIESDSREHLLASETIVGRAVTCDIVLDGAGVAMRHARINVTDTDRCTLEALSAGYDTYVNNRIVPVGQSLTLNSGDVISFGTVLLRFDGPDL